LGKVIWDNEFVDVIFNSGNGVSEVTESWFEHAIDARVLGRRVQFCAPEEMIWSKAFVMERERYDGADVAHLLRATGKSLDWRRVLQYFGPHWPVLLSHLILFDFIYPGERSPVPQEIVEVLLRRWQEQNRRRPHYPGLCQGTLLSRAQYLVDIEDWGYHDARLAPAGNMTTEEIKDWTPVVAPKNGRP